VPADPQGAGPGQRWGRNGDAARSTFTPSILVFPTVLDAFPALDSAVREAIKMEEASQQLV